MDAVSARSATRYSATNLGGGFLGADLVPVEQQHRGPVGDQTGGHSAADAARGAGDEGRVTGQGVAHERDATCAGSRRAMCLRP